MHELSVTEALLRLALKHAEAAEAGRVTDVHVVIGQLSTVVDESVQFYWDLISAGTAAEGARLHFRRVPAALQCDDCGHRYAPEADVLACPACESIQVRVTAGEEFYLEALEVEEAGGGRPEEGRPELPQKGASLKLQASKGAKPVERGCGGEGRGDGERWAVGRGSARVRAGRDGKGSLR